MLPMLSLRVIRQMPRRYRQNCWRCLMPQKNVKIIWNYRVFTNLAQFEKVAWSVPVDLDSVEYLIAYRKLSA